MAIGCVLLPGRVASQEAEPVPARASILGLVYDAVTGIPIPGAAIYLWEENQGVLADSLGTFRFEDVAAGIHAVAAIESLRPPAGASRESESVHR